MVNRRCLCVFLLAVVIASVPGAEESGSRSQVEYGTTKSVTSAKSAIKGHVSDPSSENYGVVGVSNSPDGAGPAAANTGGGPDLVLDGGGDPDAIFSQAGIDRPSGSDQSFTLYNSGGGRLDLYVDGILFGDGAGLTNVNASLLNGVTAGEFALNVDLATSGSSSVHWDNITNEPAGLWDGDDDSLGGLECGEAQIAKWNGSSWVCSHDVGVAYARTRVVGPVGTPPENGATLLDAIAGIPTPASREEAWLLKIEPGTYDVGTTSFDMKSWVDVEGSGQGVTLITGAVCEATGAFPATGLVVGAGQAELRLLTVQNTCTGTNLQSVAVFDEENDSTFDRVTALTTGAADTNLGIVTLGDDVELTHVTAVASGGPSSHYALYIASGARVRITRSSFTASGGLFATGVVGGATDLNLNDVTATAMNAATDNCGMRVAGDGASLNNVTARASGGVNRVGIEAGDVSFQMKGGIAAGEYGMDLDVTVGSETVVLHDVTLNGTTYGLRADPTHLSTLDVMVNKSSIRGPTSSIWNSGANVFVGGSQLAGGAVSGAGVTCAGVWDEGYTFSASTCP